MTGTYVRYDFLSSTECDQSIKLFLESKRVTQGMISGKDGALDNTVLRRSRVAFFDQHPFRERLLAAAKSANARFYNYEIDGLEPIQTAEYNFGDEYGWHLDIGNSGTSRRKLSVSVQLSDPSSYDGGSLEISCNGYADRNRGVLVIFPSFLAHRVHPVTRGVRYSLVGWMSGPAFR